LCFSHAHAAMLGYLETIDSSTSFSDHVRRALEVYTLAHPSFEVDEFREFAEEFGDTLGDSKATGVKAEEREAEIEIYLEQLKSLVTQYEENKESPNPHEGYFSAGEIEAFESSADDF